MAKRSGPHRPSIIGDRLVKTSVSQVKQARLCLRSWTYDKKFKLPRKTSKGLELGDACHERMEHYEKTGEDVRGWIELNGAHLLEPYTHLLPFRGGPIAVEAELTNPVLTTASGVEFEGYSDLIVPPEFSIFGDGIPEIIDHKFIKELTPDTETVRDRYGERRGYRPTASTLERDVQGLGYAAWAIRRWPNAPAIRFSHHSHSTTRKTERAVRESVILDLTTVKQEWLGIEHTVELMRAAARVKDAREVEPNEASCRAYGGCSYAAVCPNSPTNKQFAKLFDDPKEPEMGMFSELQATQGNGGTPANTGGAQPSNGGTYKVTSADAGRDFILPNGKRATLQAVIPGGLAFYLYTDGSPDKLGSDIGVTPAPAASQASPPANTNPPASNGGIQAAHAQPGKEYYVRGNRAHFGGLIGGKLQFFGASGVLIAESTETVFPVDAAPASNAPAVLPPDAPASNPAAHAASSTPPAATEDKPKRGRKGKATGAFSLELFVDTMPSTGAEDLSSYVAEKCAQLAAAANVPDIRMAPKDNPLAYSGWKGALSKAVLSDVPEGACYIARSDLTEPVIEALAGLSTTRVVRVTR